MQVTIHPLTSSCVRTLTLGVSLCTLALGSAPGLAAPPSAAVPTTTTTTTQDGTCFSEAESHGLCTSTGNLTAEDPTAGMQAGQPSLTEQLTSWMYDLLGIDLE